MYCSHCGASNEADARFCERCGADLPATSRPPASPTATAGPASPSAPVVYRPARPRAWWYPIGVWMLLGAFFLFVDLVSGGGVDWAYWPVGVIGIFLVGFPLLNLLEARMSRKRLR
ncbi:MAG: zinc-ribbon domain-containing protein [Methanobacteriota archaeon]